MLKSLPLQLDLPTSLPLTLVFLRAHILDHIGRLEARIRASTSAPPKLSQAEATKEDDVDETDRAILSTFQSHLTTLKGELKVLMQRVPSPPTLPTAPAGLPRVSFHDIKMAAEALYARLPSAPVAGQEELGYDFRQLLASIRVSLEGINESANSVMRKRALLSSWGTATPVETSPSQKPSDTSAKARSNSISSYLPSPPVDLSLVAANVSQSTAAFVQRMEEKLISIGSKGREQAGSVVLRAADVMHMTEDRIYKKALEMAEEGKKLITYADLPEMWKNNGERRSLQVCSSPIRRLTSKFSTEYILTGYRFIPSRNWGALVKSTFQLHNETGNILSHLIGALIVIPLFWPNKDSSLDPHTTPMDRFVQTLYLIAALKCLVLSVSWHVMAGCSDLKVFEMFACVDYTGIAWLVGECELSLCEEPNC